MPEQPIQAYECRFCRDLVKVEDSIILKTFEAEGKFAGKRRHTIVRTDEVFCSVDHMISYIGTEINQE